MKKLFLPIIALFLIITVHAQTQDVTIKMIHTTDLHGNFFPFDFINNRDSRGSLARVSSFINEQRKEFDHVLLLDGGDLLQGQPTVYYYNFVDTVSKHICADVMNYVGYDAAVMGNHDIEGGHAVYDRWTKECDFPVLGANILREDGTPYLPPYAIFEKGGVKIAIVGMITKAIPAWLPENLWEGLHFAGIEETAAGLLPVLKEKENPDIIVGLFHTGVKTSEVAGYKESVGLEVAQRVPGFDVIFCGHDHSAFCQMIVNNSGDSVLVIDPAAGANRISDVTIHVKMENGVVKDKTVSGHLEEIATIEPDPDYMNYFSGAFRKIEEYVNAEIGEFTHAISARDAFIGPSPFIDLLHSLQLEVGGADISLVAPLSQNAFIDSGKVYMRDMFNLYRYENLLYTMKLTGKEIKNSLEFCYGIWTNQMRSPDDHFLLIKPSEQHNEYQFVNPSFSFNSAAGIIYTVDVAKPVGERVDIISMADDSVFDEERAYLVAVNSYQGSGGGGILTDGAGIPKEKLSERIVRSTDKDLRYYLAEEIRKQRTVSPQALNQWKFIPEDWVREAGKRDCILVFGE